MSQANLTTDVVGSFTKRFKAEAAARKAAIADKVAAQRELAAVRAGMQALERERDSAIVNAKVCCHDAPIPLFACRPACSAAYHVSVCMGTS